MEHAQPSAVASRLILAATLLAINLPAYAAGVTFGELSPGAISESVVGDVHAEICRDHLLDPSALRARLPTGYRFVAASELADTEPGIASLVAGDARYAAHAVGSLCFMSVGSFIVDGRPVIGPGTTAMAFWWVRAAGPRDPRMQGPVEWLQLASWYPRGVADRARIVATDPMAQFVDLEVTQPEPGVWRMRLALEGEFVEAEVRPKGPRVARKAAGPRFMSVPLSGDSAHQFNIFTFFGHHHQAADGAWRARGAGAFVDALHIPGEATAFKTHFQDGWSARSGLYRFER